MNYELAKELKDAGFRFLSDKYELGDEVAFGFPEVKGKLLSIEQGTAKIRVEGLGMQHVPDYTLRTWREPTLSEIIEACGEKFDCLRKHENGWGAYSNQTDFPGGNRVEVGGWATPDIAAALLWLALNPKKI